MPSWVRNRGSSWHCWFPARAGQERAGSSLVDWRVDSVDELLEDLVKLWRRILRSGCLKFPTERVCPRPFELAADIP